MSQRSEPIRAVLYCRYSSHAQREVSIDQQVKECRKFAEAKGIEIIKTIHTVAQNMVMADRTAAVLNRVPFPEKIDMTMLGDMELAAVIGPDESLMENDIEGKSVFELPKDAAILNGARSALKKLGIL